jgi:hypothetical protein
MNFGYLLFKMLVPVFGNELLLVLHNRIEYLLGRITYGTYFGRIVLGGKVEAFGTVEFIHFLVLSPSEFSAVMQNCE